ncbi:TRAFAC clade GTPase domain-containing protein [Corynebacterium epidermidicanis]|nr:ATP-binding protein [Corynebacterium epidermidicanis]
MNQNRTVDQQIAVFGQSGSGKTVLLCSFYGAARDKIQLDQSLFDLHAQDNRHTTLISQYLGMKEDHKVPQLTRFASVQTEFKLKQKGLGLKELAKTDSVRLTWWDYPGDWFERGTSTESERQDKAQTFRKLLGSDVALFLVDGQRLQEYVGEEERYLRYLFDSFSSTLNDIQDDILQSGGLLKQFPRIWVLALSKADLWPDMTVQDFENLLNKKAASEINTLRSKLLEFIEDDEAFSFGKDFLLLSSAKFSLGSIDMSERKGIDVLLPLACVLPIQRHLWWHELKILPMNLAEKLLDLELVKALVPVAIKALRIGKGTGKIKYLAAGAFADLVEQMADQSFDSLARIQAEATEKREFLRALVADFTQRLNQAENDRVLLRDSK